MSKAYDRVDWNYIKQVMIKMGFCERWVNLIMQYVESVQFTVLINGEPGQPFSPQRGLRQGDPLSPYLFLFCAKGLSALLTEEEQKRHFSGLHINKHCPTITHLFYVDNNLIFFKAARKDCQTLKGIFNAYAKASGQVINFDKSQFTASKNTSLGIIEYIKSELNVTFTEHLGQYLRLPSQISRNKCQVFQAIKDRVWKVLQRWKEKPFSIGGKEVLIKAVAQAIPNYTMSCFKLPMTLCNEINGLYRCLPFGYGCYWGRRSFFL